MSVLTKIQVDLDNPTGRLDAEFFQKAFLNLPRFPIGLGDYAFIRSGTTPPDRDDGLEQGVILLKTVDIQNRVLLTQDAGSYYRISPEIAVRMGNTKLMPHDVLINIVGATTDVVGRVAFVFPRLTLLRQ